MSVTDLELLALVVDSDFDHRVLAAWCGLELERTDLYEVAERRITELIGHAEQVRRSLRRLDAARLLTDDGTSEVGRKWLATIIQRRMSTRSKRPG